MNRTDLVLLTIAGLTGACSAPAASGIEGPLSTGREAANPTAEIVEASAPARPEPAAAEAPPLPVHGQRSVDGQDGLTLWDSEGFRRRFRTSFLPLSQLEPGLSAIEREPLEELNELKAAGDQDEAIALLEYHSGDAENAQYDLLLGNLYYEQERYDGAIAMYERAVRKFPDFRRAWERLGKTLARTQRWSEARPALIRTIELGGADPDTFGLLAYAHQQERDFYSAEVAYRMAMVLDPANPDWRIELARTLLAQGKYVDAATLFDTLIAQDPSDPTFWLLQANAYLEQEDLQSAAENYEILDQLGKSTPESLNRLANIYMHEELYDLAVGAFARALQLDPEAPADVAIRNARILTSRGKLEQAGDLLTAIEALRALDLDDDDERELLRVRAALALARGGGEAEARALKRLVDLDPLDGRALLELGRYHRRSGDVTQARFYYERAQSLTSFEAEANVELAKVLAAEGEEAEAIRLLRRAQELDYRDAVQSFLDQLEARQAGR